ncbi:dTDP-4-amino-4,6-dideoxygalactose transaminase [Phycicoccus badiiscoriae]|uniref:dTDP-4-amino-4,6-dideoxygalactose transaminase n=1 Tax=Pedococcus badiiscoriae TaxID=642776 RepID=A0A852WD61_9MICO|nr:DegT/DnrJ/EryC1/StrS family aminotransferase [Pedococcus badiiscoriae]NYG07103.1 dTDP-4-amino-4,6-dideoxygalactose transaminase [Pedococcus badiiscoriae]
MKPSPIQASGFPDTSANPIPLSHPSTDEAELAAVAEVFASGWMAGQGPHGTMLEEGFKKLTGRAYAIAVNNCTAGLHLALAGLGLGAGDEVLVADYSFPATGHAVLYCGATPVFVDVREDTGTMDPKLLEEAITPRTKGILAVDALGTPADWNELQEIADRHGLFLVEDAACSAGAEYDGRPCGSFGDVAVFSLHARKGITCGEGGVIVTDDPELAASVRAASCFGMESAFSRQSAGTLALPTFAAIGYNYKLSDVLAAVAVVQLGKLDAFLDRRRALAVRYGELLSAVPGIEAPVVPPDRLSAWQTYAVTVTEPLDRDAIAMALRARGVGSTIGTYAMHLQPVYGPAPAGCPSSQRLFERQLALPMYVGLTDDQQDLVVQILSSIVAGDTVPDAETVTTA